MRSNRQGGFPLSRHAPAAAFGCALLALTTATASAASPALYWTTQKSKTADRQKCLSFAGKAMHDAKLVNIKTSPVDVSGRTANVHAAMACMATSDGMTAVIMVAGENEEAKQVRVRLKKEFSEITPLD